MENFVKLYYIYKNVNESTTECLLRSLCFLSLNNTCYCMLFAQYNPSKMNTVTYINFFGHGPISISSDNFVSLDRIPIKKGTRVQTLCVVFNQHQSKTFSQRFTSLFNNSSYNNLFLALKRFKFYLRNSITHQRLNHCMVFHIHRERMGALDLNSIAKQFARANQRPNTFFSPQYFGQYNFFYLLYL